VQNDPILTPIFVAGIDLALTGGAGAVTAGTAIGIGGVTFTVGNVATVLAAATVIAGTVALNYALQPNAPKAEQGTIPLRQTIPPRIVGYGEVRVAGNYVCYEANGAYSYDILALCQGPSGGFKQVYIDDELVTVNPTNGQCFPYPFCYVTGGIGYRDGQAFTNSLFAAVWTPDHRGARVVQLVLVSVATPQAQFLTYFPHGLPKPSAAVFLPCWDFRAPGQTADNPDTWWFGYPQWDIGADYEAGARVLWGGVVIPGVGHPSGGGMLWLCVQDNTGQTPGVDARYWAAVWKNPVLQAVTYLTSQDHGMGLPIDRLITPALAALTAQAAKCDEAVQRGDGAFEARYASNPWFKLETEPTEILGQILGACDGWVSIDGDGALALRVGQVDPPAVTLDQSIIQSIEIDYGVPDEQKVDELTLSFTSPGHKYTAQALDAWRDETAILNRGKARTQAFGPASVQSPTQLRRLAKRIFLRSNAIRGTVTTNLGGMIAAGHRYVTINYPLIPELTGVTIELRRRETDLANRQCRFDFIVADPAMDQWNTAEEGYIPASMLVLPPQPLPVPRHVGATPSTSGAGYFDVAWDDPGRPDVAYRVRYRLDAGEGFGGWVEQAVTTPTIAGDRLQTTVFVTTDPFVAIEFQAASYGTSGTLSDWSDTFTALPGFGYGVASAAGHGTAAATGTTV
jgi:hypothetical protein